MIAAMIDPQLLDFLRELALNNNKEWFNPRKEQYQRLRGTFTAGLEDIAQEIAFFDRRIADRLGDPGTVKVFRIYRDVRFSQNKEPLKTMMSGFISPGEGRPGYYLQIQPGNNSFAGGGIYRPPSASLKAVRAEINESYEELNAILQDPTFRAAYPAGIDRELALKTAPRGYSVEHPAIELLRLTSYTATRPFSDEEVVSDRFHDDLMALYQAQYPLHAYLEKALRRGVQ